MSTTMRTTVSTMPPVVITEDQVRRACAGSLADSGVCARVKEQHLAWQEWERTRDAEAAQLRAAREAKRTAEAKTRAAAAEAARSAAAMKVREGIRRRFFASNPSASAADYERLADQLYDAELLQRTEASRNAETEALRRSGDYQL